MAIYKKPNLTVAIDAEGNWKHINQVWLAIVYVLTVEQD